MNCINQLIPSTFPHRYTQKDEMREMGRKRISGQDIMQSLGGELGQHYRCNISLKSHSSLINFSLASLYFSKALLGRE